MCEEEEEEEGGLDAVKAPPWLQLYKYHFSL